MILKTMYQFCFLWVIAAATALAADQSWTGSISDSMCGATHHSDAEHGTKKMSDRDCALACVKGGSKYVFVRHGKVYNIDNQNFPDLEKHAGHRVKLTGQLKRDTITVSKIEMPAGLRKEKKG